MIHQLKLRKSVLCQAVNHHHHHLHAAAVAIEAIVAVALVRLAVVHLAVAVVDMAAEVAVHAAAAVHVKAQRAEIVQEAEQKNNNSGTEEMSNHLFGVFYFISAEALPQKVGG